MPMLLQPYQQYQRLRNTGLRTGRAWPCEFITWTSDETQVPGTASKLGQHANALVEARTQLLQRLVRANGRESPFTVHPRRPFDAILTRINRKTGVIESGQNLNRSRMCHAKIMDKHKSLLHKRAMGNRGRAFPSKEQHPSLSIHIQEPEPKSRLKYLMATRMAQESLAAYQMSKEYGWDIVQNEDYGSKSEDAGGQRQKQQHLERGNVRTKEVVTTLLRLKASFPRDFESVVVDSKAVYLALNGPPSREIDEQSSSPHVARQTAESDKLCWSSLSSSLPVAEKVEGLQTQDQNCKGLRDKARSAIRLISQSILRALSGRISRDEQQTSLDGSEDDSDDEYAELEVSWKERQFSQMRMAAWLDGIITEEQSNGQHNEGGSIYTDNLISPPPECKVEKAHELNSRYRWYDSWHLLGGRHERSHAGGNGSLWWITRKLRRNSKYNRPALEEKKKSRTSKMEQDSATGHSDQVTHSPEAGSDFEAKPAEKEAVESLVCPSNSWLRLEEVEVFGKFEVEKKDPAFWSRIK
ncbi:hypothetical protein B0A52_08698 [Exophiala mesophila]|uniref:Uncharacterized protein n=1 Tax=Exophiala mesophila TaxID=212818 RepID=A0A438MZ21_EXOME|nr:hypothetical protein B0A52_08698 [Exophiala mesophila]